MKAKGREHANHEYSNEEDLQEAQLTDHEHHDPSPIRNLEGEGKPKWYKMLPYEKIEPLIPRLRYLRGSKARFTITTFEEINKVCQQIFECNKSFFRFRAQVDLLAHYIGSKLLEELYVVRKGQKKSLLSKILESKEQEYQIWDEMKMVKEIFSDLCEKKVDGFITDLELDMQVEMYLAIFERPEDRVKMARVIDVMIDKGEMRKASDRQRKRYERKQSEKDQGIKAVK